MNLSRCEQGHFFDKEKNATCPYCAQGAQKDDSLTAIYSEELDMGMGQQNMGYAPNQGYGGGVQGDFSETVQLTGAMAQPQPQQPQPQPQPMVQNFAPEPQPVQNTVAPAPSAAFEDDDDDDHTIGIFDGMFGEAEPVRPAPPTPQQAPVMQPQMSQMPQQAPVMQAQPVPQMTSQPPVHPRNASPCTGWLVALNGTHTGNDFRLKAGKNFVGRGADMDVSLPGDKSVSRSRHAIVVYEPKQHLYLIQPGDSSELVYLNDDVVLSPMQLKAYDIITIGEVQMLFIPLCGEKFSWSDILKKKTF
jgi:hypothetical protein